MHLLVPFASDLSEACRHVLRDLALPRLARLLALLAPAGRDDGEELSLSPPHERAIAAARGWHGGDGTLPFAAAAAAADGVEAADLAWGLMTPAHWQLGRDAVVLLDPAQLGLADAESRALFATASALFESEGFAAAWGRADRWYAGRADLDGLATASLDRVIGRGVDRWLGAAPRQDSDGRASVRGLVRRLQSEVQLAFYNHPVNDARDQRGELAVNSFWLSGCGRAQPFAAAASPEVEPGLRAPLLARDWPAWADAWHALDAGPIARLLVAAERGDPVTLTLCGERSAARFESRPQGWLRRLRRRWANAAPAPLLAGL